MSLLSPLCWICLGWLYQRQNLQWPTCRVHWSPSHVPNSVPAFTLIDTKKEQKQERKCLWMCLNMWTCINMWTHVRERIVTPPPQDLQWEIHNSFFQTQPDIIHSPPLCAFNWHRNTNSSNLSPLSLTLKSVAVTQMVTAVDLWLDGSQLSIFNQSDQMCDRCQKCSRICRFCWYIYWFCCRNGSVICCICYLETRPTIFPYGKYNSSGKFKVLV